MSTRYPVKEPGETITVAFDFSKETASVSAPTVSAPTIYWAPTGSADPSPASIISGSSTVIGAQVLQKVTGGLDMNDYALRCTATAANGDILVVAAILPVRKQPA